MTENVRPDTEELADAFNHCSHGLAVGDGRTGRVRTCNPAFAAMLGRTVPETVGLPVLEVYAPASREEVAAWIAVANRDGTAQYEADMLRADGSTVPVEVSLVCVKHPDGTVSHRVASVRDLTLRRRVEAARRMTQQQYAAVFNSASVGICVTSLADGRIEDANRAFLEMFGYRREDVLGRGTVDLNLWQDTRQRDTILQGLRKEKSVREIEVRYRRRTGEFGFLLLSSELLDLEGRTVIMSLVTDITARKHAETITRLQRDLAIGLSRTVSVMEGLRLCLEAAIEAAGLDCGGFFLRDETSGALDLVIHQGLSEAYASTIRRFDARSDRGQLVAAGQAIYAKFGTLGLGEPAAHTEGLRSLALVPFRIEHEVIGCLSVASHTLPEIPERSREALEAIAADAAHAIARLRAEETLSRERTRLSNVIEATRAAVWEWNIQTNVTVFSESWAQMIGYTLAELGPTDIRTWERIGHPDDVRRSAELLGRHFAGELPYYECECRLRHKQGHWIWVLDRGRLISRTPEGEPLTMFGTHTDITATKRAAAAQQESEERLRLAVDGAQMGVFDIDLVSRRVAWSQRTEEIWGFAPREFDGTTETLMRRVPAEDQDAIRAVTAHSLRTNESFAHEHRVVWPDGSTHWVVVSGRATAGPGGSARVQGVVRDVTNRRLAEAALRESEQNYREIFNATNEAIFLHDATTGRVRDVNDAMLRMYGFASKEEYLAAPLTATFVDQPAYGPAEAQRRMKLALEEGPQVFDWKARRTSGETLWVEVSLRDSRIGGERCVLAVVRDVTARKRAENALRESEEKFLKAFLRAPNLMSLSRLEDGTFLDVNDRFLEVSGYRREEVIGRTSVDLNWIEAGDRERMAAIVREHGFVENLEMTLHAKDGRRVDVLFAGEVIMIADRPCLLSNAVDITQRKRAEGIEVARNRLLVYAGTHSLEELLVATLDEAEALTESHVGFYHFLEADQTTLSLQAWSTRTTREMCEAEGKGRHYDVAQAGVWVDCIRARRPVVHNDYASLSHRKGLPPGHARIVREMVVPIFRNDLIVGLLGVGNKPGPYTEEDVNTVFRLADLAWDIAERKRAELALREKEQRYRSLVETSFDWIWEVDHEGRYTYASPRVEEMLGYKPAEILGRTPFELMPPAEAVRVRKEFGDISAKRSPIIALINTNRHRDGRLVTIETNGVPILGADGTLRGYRGMDRDVSAQRSAEKQLRLHGAALEAAANAVMITDRAGRIEWVNPAFTTLSGWSFEEAVGRNPHELISSGQHDPAFFQEMWNTILAGRVWHGEVVNRRRDGTHRTEDVTITPLTDELGTVSHFIAIKQDITERKTLEAQSRQSQRMEAIGTLASGVAHDLNNILSPIMMVSDLLKSKLPDEQDQEILAMVHQGAQRGSNIIRQLLTFSRGIEGQRMPVQPKHLLKEILGLMRETFPREIDLHLDAAANLGTVIADPTQLHQVLLNLCVNARDAMPEGGHLHLRAANETFGENEPRLPAGSKPGPFVVIEVRDSGHGIPLEIQHRIFDPFFTTKPLGKGTGLGLSTVMGIVRSHGGFLTLDSAPGQGAAFKVHLPAVNEATESAIPAAAPRTAVGRGQLILVAEDERNIRETLRLILERAGYRVLLAVNGRDALARFLTRETDISLVLTDVMMPVMNGVALVRSLREIAPEVPVIVSSGMHEIPESAELAALGVPQLLTKPYSESELLDTIKQQLGENG